MPYLGAEDLSSGEESTMLTSYVTKQSHGIYYANADRHYQFSTAFPRTWHLMAKARGQKNTRVDSPPLNDEDGTSDPTPAAHGSPAKRMKFVHISSIIFWFN